MNALADDITLVETLRFAVPLRIADLLALPDPARGRCAQRWALDGARRLGEGGDTLQFISKRRRATGTDLRVANTFEHLAKGLAGAAVLTPGGVQFGGLHWCIAPDCVRCLRARPDPGPTIAEIVADLNRLDREYRELAGLPPWRPPPPAPTSAPAPDRIPPRRRVTTVPLPDLDVP